MNGNSSAGRVRPPIYVSSPLASLVEGIFRADTTIGKIRAKGDLGIGTFNDLDGEMVLVDGNVYCLRPEGDAEIIPDHELTPFTLCTKFEGDTEDFFSSPISQDAFDRALLDLIPSPNLMYAIRIDGRFDYLKVRSVPKQSNYLPLVEVTKLQTVFEFKEVEGTMVGFFTPGFLSGVHLPGLHLHFITADRLKGGHVLAAAPSQMSVKLQHAPAIELELPLTFDFLAMETTRDMAADMQKAFVQR